MCDHRCCAVTPALVRWTLSVEGRKSSSFNHYRSAPKRKDELMRCTCCLLYSRGDQRQLDAMIAYQCPLARLVTLKVDRSLWRDPNFVGHPTWLGVTDWKGTIVVANVATPGKQIYFYRHCYLNDFIPSFDLWRRFIELRKMSLRIKHFFKVMQLWEPWCC